ncbi:MAG: alpha/beta hydrolase family protein [Janthinobacterium lividum]
MPALPQPLPQMACLHQTTDSRPDSGRNRCSEIAENANAAGQTEGAAANPLASASGAHAQGEEVPANDSFFGTFTSCTADAIPGFSYAANASCDKGALTTTAAGTGMQAGHALPMAVSDHVAVTFRMGFVPGANNAFVGFTSAAVGVPSSGNAEQFGLRVGTTGVSLCQADTCTLLLPNAFLGAGTYDFTLMLPGDGTAVVSVIAASPADTEGRAFRVPYTVPLPVNNVEVETQAVGDQITAFASSVDRGGEAVVYPIPHREGYANSALMIPLPVTGEGSKTVAYVWIPPGYRDDAENKWVLTGHGYSQSGQMITQQYNSNAHRLGRALMDNGYVTVTMDNTVTNCWGSQPCVADIKTVAAAVQSAFSLQSQPYLLGDSMGGLQILNATAQGVIQPKALVGICINTNLHWIYFKQNQGGVSLLRGAYGFTTDEQYASATAGFDPQVAAATAGTAQANLVAVPMMLFSSDQDVTVVKAFNAALLAKTLNAAGGKATVVNTTGAHEDPSNFAGDKIVAFFNQH